MRKAYLITTLSAAAMLAACGQTDLERGASGALIGTGAAVATDNDPLVGAAAGGAVGALADDVGLAP